MRYDKIIRKNGDHIYKENKNKNVQQVDREENKRVDENKRESN